MEVRGLTSGAYELRHHRVDADHSNILHAWERLGRPDWPDDASWARLHEADRLETLEPPGTIRADAGRVALAFELPMPSISLIELVPVGAAQEPAGHR